jgi:hypothetical protein
VNNSLEHAKNTLLLNRIMTFREIIILQQTYIFCVLFVYLSLLFCSYFVVLCVLCFVLCIFIFVCTGAGLLPPGESPIAVSDNSNNNNNNNNYHYYY